MKVLKEYALFNVKDKNYDKGRYLFGQDTSGFIIFFINNNNNNKKRIRIIIFNLFPLNFISMFKMG